MPLTKTTLFFAVALLFFSLFYASCRTTKPAEEEPVDQPGTPPAESLEEEPEEIVEEEEGGSIEITAHPMQEFRAVWVATVANIDWPSAPGLPVEQQKQEMIDLLNRAAALHFNAIILQVRPAADALYNSPYEPWSYYLTGKMGQAPLPAYDPLEFAVTEAHKRGLELHAWFNPYRALHPTNRSAISPDHISRTNPGFVHRYGDFLWMDPGLPEVKEHTINVILDVVERYNIDGVHFDDYFYPYPSYAGGADFPDDVSWKRANESGNTLSRGDWRRENVNMLMKELSERIREVRPGVKFGISPFGIWRPGYPENTTGFDAYTHLYADARLWLNEGWVDYFTPQIYYKIDQTPQPFPVMLQWWTEQNHHQRHMWPGLFTSRVRTTNITWPLEEITGQVYTARGFPDVSGTVHFSMRTFMENTGNINQKIASGIHAKPAIIPPSHWMEGNIPHKPQVTVYDYSDHWNLYIMPGCAEEVRWFIVRKKLNGTWETDVIPGQRLETVFYGGPAMIRPEKVVVTAVNNIGLESAPAQVVLREQYNNNKDDGRSSLKELVPDIIPRSEWAKSQPGGYNGNAIRRNILLNDTLRFRDLTIIPGNMLATAPVPGRLFKTDPAGSQTDTSAAQTETLELSLYRNGVSETYSLKKGEAFNWYGYHIGLLGMDLPSGLVQLEIATVASLPVNRAALRNVGGAPERLRVPHRINKITLHHTGSANPLTRDDDPAEILQNLYQWGASDRNWWDVPYHYLIDLDGSIYEGRNPGYAGETNTTYDPRGHLLISVIGNYNLQEPTEAQTDAIASLMAAALKIYDLGADDIYGHDDWADTSCPGNYLRPLLDDGTLKELINRQLHENSQN